MREPFNLKDLNVLIDEAGETDLVDPDDVAKFIDHELTAAQRREIFPVLLREHVVKVYSQQRMATNIDASTVQCSTDNHPRGGRAKPALGKRVQIVREHWISVLNQRISVQGAWKKMESCTAEDLRWLSQDRRKRAQELANNAEKYARWADALEESGKTYLGELKSEPQQA